MPYYTYILQSEKNKRRYFGSCEDICVRLDMHNSGKVKSSKAYIPYVLLYFEIFETRSAAFQREMYFKSVDGYKFLKENKII